MNLRKLTSTHQEYLEISVKKLLNVLLIIYLTIYFPKILQNEDIDLLIDEKVYDEDFEKS